MSAGDVVAEEKRQWDVEKQVLMERNLEVMEENFGLRERMSDWDFLREKCFFSLVLALKLNASARGESCNIDASSLWAEASASVAPRAWDAWIQERALRSKK